MALKASKVDYYDLRESKLDIATLAKAKKDLGKRIDECKTENSNLMKFFE